MTKKTKAINIPREMEKRRKAHVRAAVKKVEARAKNLSGALEALNLKFGESTIGPLAGSRSEHIEAVRTGFERVDDLLTGETTEDNDVIEGSGIGLPRGRIIEVYGAEASGKTTIALHFIAAVQRAGGVCAFVDAEHALDAKYARRLGVNLQDLLISQPDNAEQGFDVMIELARRGAVDCIVCDSVSAMEPESEEEEDMAKSSVALQARLMSKGLRKITAHVNKNNVIMIFINQTRKKIGVRFGNPNTTSGGNALRFYASIRLEATRVKTLNKSDNKYGIRTRLRTIKNKVAPPFRDIHVDIHHNKGIVETYGDFVPGGKGGKAATQDDEE